MNEGLITFFASFGEAAAYVVIVVLIFIAVYPLLKWKVIK